MAKNNSNQAKDIVQAEIDTNMKYLQQEFDKNFIGSIEIALPEDYERLAQALAKGKNATDAYIETHPGLNATRKTISERVSRLLAKKPAIKARVAQIQIQKIRAVMPLDEALSGLGEIAKENKISNPAVSRLAYNDTPNDGGRSIKT